MYIKIEIDAMLNRMGQTTAAFAAAALFTICVTIFMEYNCRSHYHDFISGFWKGDSMVVYIDLTNNTIRIMETLDGSAIVNDDKLPVDITSSWLIIPGTSFSNRVYNVSCRTDGKANTALGSEIQQGDVRFDVYAAEGVIIVSNSNGDLCSLTIDVVANLDMI
jgi:hypothetical protein